MSNLQLQFMALQNEIDKMMTNGEGVSDELFSMLVDLGCQVEDSCN